MAKRHERIPAAASGPPRQEASDAGIAGGQVEGIPRDHWDVAIETVAGTSVIECGAIRERVSQELARTIFDAVRSDLEKR